MTINREPADHREEAVKEAARESISKGLLDVYQKLNEVRFLTPDLLTRERIESIQVSLQRLAKEAEQMGDHAKSEMFGLIEAAFYGLLTVGIADDLDKFEHEAYRASSMMDVALLALDDISSKNKGRALRAFEERD